MRGPWVFVPPGLPFQSENLGRWHKLSTGYSTAQQRANFRTRVNVTDPVFLQYYRKYVNMWHAPRFVIPGRPNPHHPKGMWGVFGGPWVNYYHGTVRPYYRRHGAEMLAAPRKARVESQKLAVGLAMAAPNATGPSRTPLPPPLAKRIATSVRRGWLNSAVPKMAPGPPPPPPKRTPRRATPRVRTRPMPNRYSPSKPNQTLANRWPKADSAPVGSGPRRSKRVRTRVRSAQ